MSLKLMSAVVSQSVTHRNPNETVDESGVLLRRLLECVQLCQKRYGGKTELATEFDACVASLCLTFEAVFQHGLRPKPLGAREQPSTLRQVSDIVANSLNVTNETPSFWPFVRRYLTRHERERYEFLKQIWTDTGRSRAWLRSALNERSLERYLHTVLGNGEILREHYESWAILRDDEKNSMLPNMAAGLGSILFAVSIDKPELNSSITHKVDSHRAKIEPIIEAPTPATRNKFKEKRRRKVAKQYISFDDDDSPLSTSVPSSSSSTASETPSLEKSKSSLVRIGETTKMSEEPRRKLSIETSGSREKFPASTPETLTPVAQESSSAIGELTPVSVELNKDFESLDNSDDILEVPSDISAVLMAVEFKNKEELSKKDERIGELLRENESLKEQVKKYVSAIRMLGKDDEALDGAMEGLRVEAQPDYKVEAKMYEKKLVQVADMHAELMDFNVMLQQQLCQKESLLERLKKELETLRGPMSEDEFVSDETRECVNVWIPSAFLTGSGSASHHVYQIFLRAGNDEWNIYRRYAQFHALHTDLKKLDPVVSTFDFPPKKSLGNKDSAVVEDRRKRLQCYLRKVLAHWPELSHCNSRYLLEQHLAFFKDQREDVQNRRNIFTPRRQAGSHSNSSGL